MEALKSEENIEDIKSIEVIFPGDMRTNEIKNEIDEIKKWEGKINWKDSKYETKNYIYDFQQYKTVRSFSESIDTCKASMVEAEEDQSNLLENLVKFKNKSRPKKKEGNDKKGDNYESPYALYEGQKLALNAFKSGIFPIKTTQGAGRPSDLAMELKILTPKQMLERLPIALAQVKAGNTLEDWLNEIRRIIYSLYRAK